MIDIGFMAPCNQEECDTRQFIHIQDCVSNGYYKVMISANDTDVVVIALYAFTYLSIDELWIEYGVGKYRRWLPIHRYAQELGDETCKALPYWYALTGCDTVSSFAGRGKKTAWDTWKVHPEVTSSFLRLSSQPDDDYTISDEDMRSVERFVVLLYDRSSAATSVNESPRILFTQKKRSIKGLPPLQIVCDNI